MDVQTQLEAATIESIKKEMKSLGWEPVSNPTFSVEKHGCFEKVVALSFKTIEKHNAPCCGLPHYGRIGSCKTLPEPEEYRGANAKRVTATWSDALELMREYPQEAK